MTRSKRNWWAILRSLAFGRQPETSLILPVPHASAALAAAHDGEPSADSSELPPYITVLYPFMPPEEIDSGLEATIASVLADFTPFRFRLSRVASFPGVLYLEPDPSQPFVELTEAFCGRWPEYPPYRGEFDEIVPHLTVSTGGASADLVARLRNMLPIEATADQVWLLSRGDRGPWTMRRRFLFGQNA